MNEPDLCLLDRYRRLGAQDAFGELVTQHMGLVYHACLRRLGDSHLAEDAAQAVFVVLARRGPDERCATVAGWLYRTAQHVCANLMRERSRRSRREQLVAAHRREDQTNQDTIDAATLAELERALAALAPSDRDLLIMRFYEGRELRDVATTLGITTGTAAQRVSRAIRRVRRAMASRGVHVAGAAIVTTLTTSLAGAAPSSLVAAASLGPSAAGAAGAVELIAKGAINMLLKAKIRLIAATASCVIVTGGLVSMPLLFAQSKTASPATPTTQPQAAARATESTPQKTLKEFAAAVRKGDARALVALSKFDPNEDNEKMLIESSSAYVAATADFKKAVKDKFGADALKEVDSLLELTPVGRFTMFIETSVDKVPAEIEGDTAMLQAPGAGDQPFWLERENGVWKLSVKRMTEHWTADEFQDRCGLMKMAASGLAHYTTAIQNGKYETLNELKLEIAPILRQNR